MSWLRLMVFCPTLLVALSVGALTAAESSAGGGQILQLANASTDVDASDPALAYGTLSWEIEYETCAKLVDYSDAGGTVSNELSPDAATGMPVIGSGGRFYSFTIRPGVRFSDGTTVTAASFADALNRDANPTMNSPVDAFMGDVVGWDAVVDRKAKVVSGVVASGDKLTIRLTRPDGGLLDKLAMPFFCAIDPARTPVDAQGLKTLPGAGPYYIASRTVGKQLVLKVNPYYTGDRPHRASAIVVTMNTDPQSTYLQVSNGTYAADPSGLDDPAAAAGLAKTYGINRTRFFVHSVPETDYLSLNTARSAFASVALRKAVNYAIDRPALARVRGFDGGEATAAILPPSLSGGVAASTRYPIDGPNLAKAKALAGGRCGDIQLWHAAGPVGTPWAGILAYDLGRLGCKVTQTPFQGYALTSAAGVKGAPYDVVVAGWYEDYADGYDFFHVLLDGRTIQTKNNNNLSYFRNSGVDGRIDAANRLTGTARARAWGLLDNFTMDEYAPWAPFENQTVRDFIGPKTAGYLFVPPYGSMDLGALYLK